MNWNKAKTILIIFFICTNLFLLSTIIISTGRTSIITDDIVQSTVAILKNNRIEIDPEIIPRKTQPISVIEAENIIDSYDSFAKKFAGGDAAPAEDNSYSGEYGKIFLYGDKFEFVPYNPQFPELTKNISPDNAKQTAINILGNYGIKDDNMTIETTENNGTYTVSITKQKDGLYFFNSYIELILSKEGLHKISGSWFYEKIISREKTTLKNITGVLIDYISLANRPTSQEKIVSLDLGYSILEEGIYHKSIVLTPCWRISLDDGREYILSAAEPQITN